MRIAAIAAVLAALATIERDARADLSNEARADQLFHRAQKEFDAGDYPAACADFSESLRLGPKLGTLLNLALCHEMTGRIVTAWHEFTHGATWAAQNGQRDRLEFARDHVRSLEPRLPRVVLRLPLARVSAIDLDGEPLPETRWYLPLYLDPGEHRLAVTAPGKERTTISFRVILSPTDQIVEVPSLRDDEKALGSPRPAADGGRRTLAFVALGVGGAGLLTAIGAGAIAVTTERGDPALKDWATASAVGATAGTLLAAAGVWLLLTSERKR